MSARRNFAPLERWDSLLPDTVPGSEAEGVEDALVVRGVGRVVVGVLEPALGDVFVVVAKVGLGAQGG